MYSLLKKMKKAICKKHAKTDKLEKENIKESIRITKNNTITIKKIFHSTFLITYPDGITVLTDPYFNNISMGSLKLAETNNTKKESLPKIDIILISHEHFDHFDKEAIKFFVERDKCIVIGPLEVTKELELQKNEERTVKVDDEIVVATIKIKVVPAQHHQSFYPVGFVLEKDNKKIYFAGDTNTLPNIVKDINLAIMPCGGIFTSDLFEFISMVRQLKCEIAIPMHYNTFEIIKIDCEKLKVRCEEKLKNSCVKILENGESMQIKIE